MFGIYPKGGMVKMCKMTKSKKRRINQLSRAITKTQANCVISDQMKKRLNSLGPSGSLIWSLSEEQQFYIENNYGYTISPYIYKIRTGKFSRNLKNQPAIIKELIRAAYNNQKFIARTLKKQDMQILDSLKIYYQPIKYLITTSQ